MSRYFQDQGGPATGLTTNGELSSESPNTFFHAKQTKGLWIQNFLLYDSPTVVPDLKNKAFIPKKTSLILS